ncbi:MAG: DUF3971 domain-containing protein [Hyphomonadaceae bacterium]|nr:DUF3971 domain-containing protein [Hyphomonadaceae bacterium]
MIRRSSLILFEILVGTLVTLGFGVAFAAWRLSQGPIELVPIKRQIESQLSAARGGRPVTIDRVELAWSEANRGLELKAHGVKALSADGRVLTESRAVDIGISLQRLALGRLAVERAAFDGADITVTLAADGSAGLAFGPPGSPADILIPAPPPNETVTQRVNRILDGMASVFRPVGFGAALRSVQVDNARLSVVDARSEGIWRAEGARVDLTRNGSALRLAAAAAFRGPRGPAPAAFAIDTDTSFTSALIALNANKVQPAAIIPESALGPLAGLESPVTAAVTVGLDRKVGVTLINGDVEFGRGTLALGGGRMDIAGARFRGGYDLASDVLGIEEIAIGGGGTRIEGRIAIEKASAFLGANADQPARFNLNLPALSIAADGVFSAPVALRDVVVRGEIAPKDSAIRFEEVVAHVDNARFAGAGRIHWADDGHGKLRPGFEATGAVTGGIDARRVLSMWPLKAAEGARSWLETGLVGGRITQAAMRIDIRPADLAAPQLPDDRLSLTLSYEGAQVRYFQGMTPITEGRGDAEMKGNRFNLRLSSGKVGALTLTQGRVDLPRLRPRGAIATYAGRVEGDAKAMVDLLHQMPIKLDERFPARRETVVGRGVADFALHRPMLSNVAARDLKWDVDARLDGVGAVARDGKYTIANWRMRATGDQDAMTFSGPLTINQSQANLTWTELFAGADPAVCSRYVIDGRFDARDIEKFGIGVAQYARGLVGVQLTGEGKGLDVTTGAVRLDLKDAEIALPSNAWVKRAGRPSSASFDVRQQADGGLQLTNLDMKGPGFAANGVVTVGADNTLQSASFQRIWIDGRTDLRATARRSRSGVLLVSANGPSFDAVPFMTAKPVDEGAAAAAAAAKPERWDAAIQADRIRLKGDAELADGRIEGTWIGPVMTRLDVRGAGPNNGQLMLSLGGADGALSGPLRFRADDMGFAYRAVTGADNVRGGQVEGAGTWQASTARAEVTVKAKNFQVVKLGPMARLLSSVGSLRGLAEMLNGDGVSFTGLEAPLTIVDGRLYVAESRAAGPSIGITAKGAIELADGTLDLDGVIVPSYGLNSMLSGVPVLGSLLASRPGEGVLGLTYSMNGPSDQPRVGVNPLSALTPGILRRIFEPWAAPQAPPKAAVATNG